MLEYENIIVIVVVVLTHIHNKLIERISIFLKRAITPSIDDYKRDLPLPSAG